MKKRSTARKFLTAVIIIVFAVAILFAVYGIQKLGNKFSGELSLEEAQQIVNESLGKLPNPVSPGAKYVFENSEIIVTKFPTVQKKMQYFPARIKLPR